MCYAFHLFVCSINLIANLFSLSLYPYPLSLSLYHPIQYPKLSWPLVIKHLDHPEFQLHDPKGLALVMSIYRKATKEPFPSDFLIAENWKNTAGQLSFLKLAVAAPPDVFNFATASSLQRIPDSDGMPPSSSSSLLVGSPVIGGSPAIGGASSKSINQSWYSLSLIETMLRLGECENYNIVRGIFNYPIKHCPELLLLGLAQAKVITISPLCLSFPQTTNRSIYSLSDINSFVYYYLLHSQPGTPCPPN